MNGQYRLINRKGTKFKFYWAPYSPWPERDYADWGVAVVDLAWPILDPRPKHLRAKPLDYELKPFVQILRDPVIKGELDRSYRYTVLNSHLRSAIEAFMRGKRDYVWISG